MPRRKQWDERDLPGALDYLRRRANDAVHDGFFTGEPTADYDGDAADFDVWLREVLTPDGRTKLLTWVRVARKKHGIVPTGLPGAARMTDEQLADVLIARLREMDTDDAVALMRRVANESGVVTVRRRPSSG